MRGVGRKYKLRVKCIFGARYKKGIIKKISFLFWKGNPNHLAISNILSDLFSYLLSWIVLEEFDKKHQRHKNFVHIVQWINKLTGGSSGDKWLSPTTRVPVIVLVAFQKWVGSFWRSLTCLGNPLLIISSTMEY